MRLTDAEARGRRGVREVLADADADPDADPDADRGRRVVVGVSGGADSLALAACVAFVADRDGLDATCVVVDHALQEGSARVARGAAEQVRALGLPAEVAVVEVGTDGGPEGAARAARRGALLDAAGPTGVVLVAHTLDDQAETVLLGLGRGSGARSLAGMRAVDGPWRRPFLGLRRVDTEEVCRAHDLTWWDDPHNLDPRFRRSRVRHEVLPLLEEVLGGAAVSLARTADLLRADADALDALAADVADPAHVPTLAALHPALRSRVLRRLALDAGASASELTSGHVAELDRLVTDWRGQRRVELPGGVCVVRDGDRLGAGRSPVAG